MRTPLTTLHDRRSCEATRTLPPLCTLTGGDRLMAVPGQIGPFCAPEWARFGSLAEAGLGDRMLGAPPREYHR